MCCLIVFLWLRQPVKKPLSPTPDCPATKRWHFGVTVSVAAKIKESRDRNGSPSGQKPPDQISRPTCQMKSQPAAGHTEA
ncbi:hypothetical protein E8E12_001570 [Didymella heteroderae]|uniref:Secreted protein n=1 Tax=Didymella heteroderae TaxID=1769908 RepID=A0A9P4WG39_9PLEO|nr:hypothetical protein E8E12_001570 [Didymella heteroderae]